MRVVQFKESNQLCAAKVVDDNRLQYIDVVGGIYEAATQAIKNKQSLSDFIDANLSDKTCAYDDVINEGRLLLPVMHPNASQCLVAGTGLTHLGSANARNALHQDEVKKEESEMTDSMKMFQMGVDNGKPANGKEGAQPEWFYKGDGNTLVSPGEDLPVPGFALDAGEEPELVGIYVVDASGVPHRVGFAVGNEFSDHVTEKGNYLWLAHSKLRYSSYGPELFVGEIPTDMKGVSKIVREDKVVWEKEFLTGEDNMSHSIANLEHHHFKYQQFCVPGQMHVHYFGTSTASFGDGFVTEDGDVFEIAIPDFGRPLKNKIRKQKDRGIVEIKAL